ncbi:MAG: 2-C-methyl-D-erythritol 4-phosphate cytidylyltransferase [Bacteroidetes bacterium]|nr:2-C-methyl-D-erythritol 4-phosphate cytidylyltransferase [Bacteroidota bacterium]
MLNDYLILVAGGSGTRIKSSVPKQFLPLLNEPILAHSIRPFLRYNPLINIIIATHPDYDSLTHEIVNRYYKKNKITIVHGGKTRFHSVKNALEKIPANQKAVVAIHDAARPFVNAQTIKHCFEGAELQGNAVPCVMANESLRKVNANNNLAVNRAEYRIVQTPQCFNIMAIKKAFEQQYNELFTDDASVFEKAGNKINLVEGNIENTKITTDHDYFIAKLIFF